MPTSAEDATLAAILEHGQFVKSVKVRTDTALRGGGASGSGVVMAATLSVSTDAGIRQPTEAIHQILVSLDIGIGQHIAQAADGVIKGKNQPLDFLGRKIQVER